MTNPAKFWDKIADRYSKQPVADEEAYQHKLQVTRNYFKPEMEVLEIGCGTGSTAIAHAPYVKHIRAIDISSNMIEIAQAKVAAENITNITFETAAIDDLAIPDQSIDAALGLSILHLLDNKEDTIAKVHKLLKPEGVFVTSTACIGDKMGFMKFILPIGSLLGLMPTVKVFTQRELEQSITNAGFLIDHIWKPEKGLAVFIVAKKA